MDSNNVWVSPRFVKVSVCLRYNALVQRTAWLIVAVGCLLLAACAVWRQRLNGTGYAQG